MCSLTDGRQIAYLVFQKKLICHVFDDILEVIVNLVKAILGILDPGLVC